MCALLLDCTYTPHILLNLNCIVAVLLLNPLYTTEFFYRSTSLCQTCLSRILGICRSDHLFPSISPILLCISNLFMSNLVITKSQLYRSVFSFRKISFLRLYNYFCRSKSCAGYKIKQYECQTK